MFIFGQVFLIYLFIYFCSFSFFCSCCSKDVTICLVFSLYKRLWGQSESRDEDWWFLCFLELIRILMFFKWLRHKTQKAWTKAFMTSQNRHKVHESFTLHKPWRHIIEKVWEKLLNTEMIGKCRKSPENAGKNTGICQLVKFSELRSLIGV